MVVLSYVPEKSTNTTVWVGKGIVYDTGGLSIKGSSFMTGMKRGKWYVLYVLFMSNALRDMGGAAAIFNAFVAAVKTGQLKNSLHAVLCIGNEFSQIFHI